MSATIDLELPKDFDAEAILSEHELGGQMVVPRNVSRIYVAGGAWLFG